MPRLDNVRVGTWREMQGLVARLERGIDEELRAEWDITIAGGNYISTDYRSFINQRWLADPANPTTAELADRNAFIYRQHHGPDPSTTDMKVDNGDGVLVGAAGAIGWDVV